MLSDHTLLHLRAFMLCCKISVMRVASLTWQSRSPIHISRRCPLNTYYSPSFHISIILLELSVIHTSQFRLHHRHRAEIHVGTVTIEQDNFVTNGWLICRLMRTFALIFGGFGILNGFDGFILLKSPLIVEISS